MLGLLAVMSTLPACGFGEYHPMRLIFGGVPLRSCDHTADGTTSDSPANSSERATAKEAG
jgi:hypothetical protein